MPIAPADAGGPSSCFSSVLGMARVRFALIWLYDTPWQHRCTRSHRMACLEHRTVLPATIVFISLARSDVTGAAPVRPGVETGSLTLAEPPAPARRPRPGARPPQASSTPTSHPSQPFGTDEAVEIGAYVRHAPHSAVPAGLVQQAMRIPNAEALV